MNSEFKNLDKIKDSKIINTSDLLNKDSNYPEIYLIDNNKIIFATKGFKLGVIDLILKK